MDENMERTPHPEEPAEGATDADGTGLPESAGRAGRHDGDPATIPAHNSAPDGYAPAEAGTDAAARGRDGTHPTETGGAATGQADGTGGAIQGDSPADESTGGALQGDAGPHHSSARDGYAAPHHGSERDGHDGDPRTAPLGGDATTEEQLSADNEVEEDSLKTLDPNDPPA